MNSRNSLKLIVASASLAALNPAGGHLLVVDEDGCRAALGDAARDGDKD